MLETILESNYGSLILAFLLLAPARAFAGVELTARLGIPGQKFNEAMLELLEHGYVREIVRKKQCYYLVRDQNPLLAEVQKDLLKHYRPYEDELVPAVKKIGDIQSVFLSGVFVGNPDLPVDILIVGVADEEKLQKFLENCTKLMGQEINYSVMSPEEFKVRRNTFDRFIKDIFDYRHVVLFDAR